MFRKHDVLIKYKIFIKMKILFKNYSLKINRNLENKFYFNIINNINNNIIIYVNII